jgi:hypothetical protein
MHNLSPDDLSTLSDPQIVRWVEQHLTDDPAQLAFRLKCGREQARLICGQVKYLQRARNKLPSYYDTRCILPPLSYEQCSSEAAASAKGGSGKLCIDLTCGLGVDSFYFSKRFDRVIAVERDETLAAVARHNFSKLGADNVTVEHRSAEEFLNGYSGPRADLIYLDPARRSDGERVFLLEACSPNAVELLPLLLEKAERVLIKLSPLFDVEEALQLFAGRVSELRIVSLGGEVRELLVELTTRPEDTRVTVGILPDLHFSFAPEDISLRAGGESFDPSDHAFLLVPDPAFYKGRLTGALLRRFCSEDPVTQEHLNGFIFSKRCPEDFPGRVYRILESEEYRPKHLGKRLRAERIERVNLLRRHFPQSSEEIKRVLNLREGGTVWLAFTAAGGKPRVFRVEPVKK